MAGGPLGKKMPGEVGLEKQASSRILMLVQQLHAIEGPNKSGDRNLILPS